MNNREAELDALFQRARLDPHLADRLLRVGAADAPCLGTPEDAAQYAQARLMGCSIEHLLVFATDTYGRIVYTGTQVHSERGILLDYPVLLRDLLRRATAPPRFVWVAHNHPSGDAQHSPADLRAVHALTSALRVCGLELAASLVVADTGMVHYLAGTSL